MKKAAIVIAAVVLLICAVVLANGKKQYTYSAVGAFDTVTVILGAQESEEEFLTNADILYRRLEWYHKLFDIYNEYDGITSLAAVNRLAAESPVEVDKEVIQMLKTAKELYSATNGQVNVAMGRVTALWKSAMNHYDNTGEVLLPNDEELLQASLLCDLDKVVLDDVNNTVFFAEKGIKLDVGAVAKGYAAERVTLFAKEKGLDSYLINAGGNVCAVGKKYNGKSWAVQVESPREGVKTPVLMIEDASVVTSSGTKRCFGDNGEYHHIIDPDTLMPSDSFLSVTVIADSSAVADGLSTALFNMGQEEAISFAEGLEGIGVVFVTKDGRVLLTREAEKYEKKN